ncbi:hypothetical protein AcV7_001082 [Taiwanofungus camphoratus]|nr:hypothetical protein AcV7_001082 [Antrodia cinnamomea]
MMTSGYPFKIPSIVLQDLQLIHNLIGEEPIPPLSTTPAIPDADHDDDSIASSDSEREVEADILTGLEEEDISVSPNNPISSDFATESDSSSDTDSDSDSDVVGRGKFAQHVKPEVDMDYDEEAEQALISEARSKNEISEAAIVVPEVEEVGPDEVLEKVGEVMSIVDKVVIVKGSASEISNRASERALDSDTLLVFEDRKVLGYIYETFGPTSQPFYQVKFDKQYPLDLEKVRVLRPVFHVPERSNFVFVRQLRHLKGSDASNVHDEEPAEDELEFSDDEEEAAHKRVLTQRRERYRSQSVSSSRHATPTPSQMRDQDMIDDLYGPNPYDEQSSYNDMDFGAGPSRPAPIPYDDPYSDSYGMDPQQPNTATSFPLRPPIDRTEMRGDHLSDNGSAYDENDRGQARRNDKGPARGATGKRVDRGRARGRGRDRRRNERGRGRARGDGRRSWAGDDRAQPNGTYSDEYDPHTGRSLSPTSLAIARATGQYSDGTVVGPEMHHASPPPVHHQDNATEWSYFQHPVQQSYNFPYDMQNQYVQPHINPRFASAFGINFGFSQGNQYTPYVYENYGVGASANRNEGWRPSDGTLPVKAEDGSQHGDVPES